MHALASAVLLFAALSPLSGKASLESAGTDLKAGTPTAYSSLVRPVVTGCAPILHRWSDGSISFGGCPDVACPQSNCQYDGSDSDEIGSCHCPSGGAVLCKGVVFFDEAGAVTDWACSLKDCPGVACDKVATPPPPAVGHTAWNICNCR